MPTNKKKDKKKVRRQRKPRVKKEEKAFTIREPIKPGIGGNVGTSLVHQLDNKLAEFNKNQFIRQFTPVGLPAAFGGFPAPEKKEEKKEEIKLVKLKKPTKKILEKIARDVYKDGIGKEEFDDEFSFKLESMGYDPIYEEVSNVFYDELSAKHEREAATVASSSQDRKINRVRNRITTLIEAPEEEEERGREAATDASSSQDRRTSRVRNRVPTLIEAPEEEERGGEAAIQTVIEPPVHQDFTGQTIIQPPEHPRFHGHVVN